MLSNEIITRRRSCTFETYNPKTPTQEQAKEMALATAEYLTGVVVSTDFNRVGAKPEFGNGLMFILAGTVGTGKTHLLEAIINHLDTEAGPTPNYAFLAKGNFDQHAAYRINNESFGGKSIIFIDDLFNNVSSVDKLDPYSIRSLMDLVTLAYNHQRAVVFTTNFPVTAGILPLFQKIDPIGRAHSRCSELIHARSGEIVIEGPDYRQILAQQPTGLFARFPAATA